jgi:hypothetical protein
MNSLSCSVGLKRVEVHHHIDSRLGLRLGWI